MSAYIAPSTSSLRGVSAVSAGCGGHTSLLSEAGPSLLSEAAPRGAKLPSLRALPEPQPSVELARLNFREFDVDGAAPA